MRIFAEELVLQEALRDEWYKAMHTFTDDADGIFSEKARTRDVGALVWDRIAFPRGFVQVLRQKVLRLDPLVADGAEEANRDKLLEELQDIMNYARMFGAIVLMLEARRRRP